MKKLYITGADLSYGGAAWRAAAKRIGAEITPIPTADSVALPLTDSSTNELARKGIVPSKWLALLDRIELVRAGIPAIPAFAPINKTDELPFSGSAFVKPRRTNRGTPSYAYKRYESVADFHASVGEDFWAYQKSPDPSAGEYIVSPAITAPFGCLEACFAINSLGEVKVVFSNMVVHDTPKLLGNGKPTALPQEVFELVQTVCSRFSITNALISIQFAPYQNQWVVMDWHLRPPALFTEGLVLTHPGACDSGLAHMLDGHVADTPFYLEQRAYWKTGIPSRLHAYAASLGLTPRAIQNGVFGRVSGIGDSQAEVEEKFRRFEEVLCLSVVSQP